MSHALSCHDFGSQTSILSPIESYRLHPVPSQKLFFGGKAGGWEKMVNKNPSACAFPNWTGSSCLLAWRWPPALRTRPRLTWPWCAQASKLGSLKFQTKVKAAWPWHGLICNAHCLLFFWTGIQDLLLLSSRDSHGRTGERTDSSRSAIASGIGPPNWFTGDIRNPLSLC